MLKLCSFPTSATMEKHQISLCCKYAIKVNVYPHTHRTLKKVTIFYIRVYINGWSKRKEVMAVETSAIIKFNTITNDHDRNTSYSVLQYTYVICQRLSIFHFEQAYNNLPQKSLGVKNWINWWPFKWFIRDLTINQDWKKCESHFDVVPKTQPWRIAPMS